MNEGPARRVSESVAARNPDAVDFEIDALAYRLMERAPGLRYEDAAKKAREALKEFAEEDKEDASLDTI